MSNSTIAVAKVNEEAGKKSKAAGTQRQPKSKGAYKLPLGNVEKALCEWIDQKKTPLISDNVLFDAHYGVWRPDTGEPQILSFDLQRKVMKLCSPDEMAGVLADQVQKIGDENFRISFSQAKEVVKRWKVCGTRTLKEWPKPVGFKSSEGMFFSRLSFDPASDSSPAHFPIIDEILGRMSHSDRFCQLLGSCFFPTAPRKQALWLYGESNSGKSFLLNNVVTKLCGGKVGTATFSGEALKGSHWKEPLIAKTILVVNEASSRFLGDSFKSLTGDDLHMINPKGLKMFQGHIDCRVFFSSNDAPEIKNDAALKNRLVVCKMTAVTGKMLSPEVLEEMIEGELPYFVAWCMEQYARLEGDSIQSDSEELDDAISSFEEEFQYVFDCCFIADKKSSVTAFDLQARLKSSHHLSPTITLKKFREFLKNTYGITSKKTGRGNNRPYVYFGLREKLVG